LETLNTEVPKESVPIFLTGFSGTGKSTIGQALAFQLGRRFFDLDQEIELLSGKTIAGYIETFGEEKFRDLEEQILRPLCLTQKSVIALGGGALLRERNLRLIKASGCLIYLSSSLERLSENLKGKTHNRPLLKSGFLEDIAELFETREANYLRSDIIVELEDQSVREAANEIGEQYQQWVQHNTLN
jgi:shikimate kinase